MLSGHLAAGIKPLRGGWFRGSCRYGAVPDAAGSVTMLWDTTGAPSVTPAALSDGRPTVANELRIGFRAVKTRSSAGTAGSTTGGRGTFGRLTATLTVGPLVLATDPTVAASVLTLTAITLQITSKNPA